MDLHPFSYMRWAKEHAGAHAFDLTLSGVKGPPLPPVADPSASRCTPGGDGDPACEALVAERYGVHPDHVLFVPGGTLGNFLLAWLHISPGDAVLVESPAYENLPGLVRLFGARVLPLPRRPEEGYRVDPARVEAGLAAGARLVLLTDLHNPSGAHLADGDLGAIRTAAARAGAVVVMDEVYRDYLEGSPGTAYRPDDPAVLVVSSLTKVYGMGPARTGWMLAPPPLRRRAMELLDYLTVLPPAPAAAAAEHVLSHAEEIRDLAKRRAREGRTILESWMEERGDVSWVPPAAGVIGFPRVEGIPDTGGLCGRLLRERDTAVVPGRFFGDPSRFRIGFGGEPDVLREALRIIGEEIDRER